MNKSIKTLQAAQTTYDEAIKLKQKILDAIAKQTLPEVDSNTFYEAQAAYEAAAADMAIGALSEDGLASYTKALKDAQILHDKAIAAYQHSKAVINGLQSKLQNSESDLSAAKADLIEAEGLYLKAEIETADMEYLKLAKGVQEQYKKITTCTRLIRNRQLQTLSIPLDAVVLSGIGPLSCAFVVEQRPNENYGIGKPLFLKSERESEILQNEILKTDEY